MSCCGANPRHKSWLGDRSRRKRFASPRRIAVGRGLAARFARGKGPKESWRFRDWLFLVERDPVARRAALAHYSRLSGARLPLPNPGYHDGEGEAAHDRAAHIYRAAARMKKCPWTCADECSTARERKTGIARSCGRHKKKNPLLQVVLPNRRGRRNPHPRGRNPKIRSDQRITVGGFVSRAVAATYPGFQKALAVHRKFHGREPVHFTRLRIEDGQKHVTRRALVMIGEVPSLEYRTWKHANSVKSFTRDGRRITWKHKMGEHGGRPPYAMHDPQSGITELVGGTYRIAGRPAFYHN